ncbi:facilitated trehalose transporter Tret1 [Musca vetustissima]|uniref:facilitated trehalose transporter Tret1 n=1 Tax=Musca vetustissima TaxID=27455 RepID=UPI002AB6E026|nr:facilitated trehalose transporter Tret1 [Musca vetustissima]
MSSQTRNQYITGLCANIISISYGAFVGWASASFVELQSADANGSEPLIGDDAGWIGSMLCVGGSFGTAFFSWSADKIGRKPCLLLLALPALLGWLIVPFAKSSIHLAISRLMGGFSGGGTFSIIPIYTAEISDDNVRGTVGTFLVLFCNVGVLVAFILGTYLSCRIVAWILSTLPLAFLCGVLFVPESPQYLTRKNDVKAAEKSLCFFRNISYQNSETDPKIKLELQNLMEKRGDHTMEKSETNASLRDFAEPKARKALWIGIALMAINQLCGCFVMLNYTATIFKNSGSTLPPNQSAIVVGVIQLVGTYVSTLLVERAGRKILLIVSVIGTGTGLLCLGLFMCLGDLTTGSWIPVACFSFIIFIGCWGVITLPFVVVAEIMPPKVRNLGCMICMLSLWVYSFFLLKYMGLFSELIGMHGIMFFFSACSFIGAIFIGIFVPETKGKPIEEILQSL